MLAYDSSKPTARFVICALAVFLLPFFMPCLAPAQSLHFGYENESELLSDFVSQSPNYANMGPLSLATRKLSIEPGRFGNAIHIQDGWPVSKGTWNESGLDCDLIVAVMWGEWRTKPHNWGAGGFHGDRGTVAFWVKKDTLHPGIVFMQGSIAWGRKERDLFTVEVDDQGYLSAHIRDVRSQYHRVKADRATWKNGIWQHIAVTYDRAYGLKLYTDGELVGSTWGEDAWWQTPYPGLFSPFLPESFYDELYYFDTPLSDAQIHELYASNKVSAPAPGDAALDQAACARLLREYADLYSLDLPIIHPDTEALSLKQTEIEECSDENMPAWWVMDGRYELAWPHPYRLFTFVLGDADFHGTKVDFKLARGEKPNYISIQGNLDRVSLLNASDPNDFDEKNPIFNIRSYTPFFFSSKIPQKNIQNLRIPLVESYGSPPGLEGSAHLPLNGDTRIHEIQLWEVRTEKQTNKISAKEQPWYLTAGGNAQISARYQTALKKLAGSRDRTIAVTNVVAPTPGPGAIAMPPLQAVQLFSPGLIPDFALDTLELRLLIAPNTKTDFLWIKLRDPGLPSRIWAQSCIRVEYPRAHRPQYVQIKFDILDLMVASEDDLWLELTSANGAQILCGDSEQPSLILAGTSDHPEESLEQYTCNEMHPCQMQYMKEYNYRPWRFSGERVNIQNWSNFGGPYDMAYPPLAVLRHDPDNELANIYKTLLFDRIWPGSLDPQDIRFPIKVDAPNDAPDWAVWERELYALNRRASHWTASQQRQDGMFWGGPNDDSFIVLGYAGMPLLGDEIARKAWLRFYDGSEQAGIFKDGYCDIWPIDPLHITDFTTSRGLLISYALGDPRVFERELRTAERYDQRVRKTNAARAQKGLPPLTGVRGDREKQGATLIECMDSEIRDYSLAHVQAYWGVTPRPEPYAMNNPSALANQMMETVLLTDDKAVFALTKARVHTDNQRGFGRDQLIAAALGGRVQYRAEPFPISIAASWKNADTDELSRLVRYADEKSLTISLFNFSSRALKPTMRVWRLQKGRYAIEMFADNNGDGVPDTDASGNPEILYAEQRELKRFSTLPISVPAKSNALLKITQIAALPESERLPDLAIGASDAVQNNSGNLEITVHNIGAAPASGIQIAILHRGRVLAERNIAKLDTPIDNNLAAQRAKIVFEDVKYRPGLTIQIDPDNRIEEILEENNQIELE